MKNQLKTLPPQNSLARATKQTICYLELLRDSCLRFQTELRKKVRTFNVWKYLEEEYQIQYARTGLVHRIPPKASTIYAWFDLDPINGAKMGTEDFRFICNSIGDPIPLLAYYEQSIEPFDEVDETSIITDLTKLNSMILKVTEYNGMLACEFNSSLADDNKITKDEAFRIKTQAKRIIQQASKIVTAFDKKK